MRCGTRDVGSREGVILRHRHVTVISSKERGKKYVEEPVHGRGDDRRGMDVSQVRKAHYPMDARIDYLLD